MVFNNIFVTVGTTQFNALISFICTIEFYQVLKQLGCKKLTIQHGKGKVNEQRLEEFKDIDVNTYELKSTIAKDVAQADLVISHAGAGSCIEVLRAGKPLLVVVNDQLADNHQVELAEQLCKDGYLHFCTPSQLTEALSNFDSSTLKKYEDGRVKEFVRYLDEFMGFENVNEREKL